MNILDYLKWRGDLTFKQDPFNEIDNLIISQMAYTVFDPYVKETDSYTVKEVSDMYFKDHTEQECKESKSFVGLAPLVLKGMAETTRFKDAIIHDFISNTDQATHQQFACFSINLSDKTTYIAFRGTDDTLVGWHEDLCLSYETVPAQISAVNYVNTHIKRGKKYRIGGHSKGGNLAIYSVLSLKRNKNSIINIYSNDGPGLHLQYLTEDQKKTLAYFEPKIIKIVPEFDIFGILFSRIKNTKVIRSDGFTVMQHSAMTWLVEGKEFIPGTLSDLSITLKASLDSFLETMSQEECHSFCDEVFKELDEAGIQNITDFADGGISVFIKALVRLSKLSNSNKQIAKQLLLVFVNSSKSDLLIKVSDLKSSVKQNALDLFNAAKAAIEDSEKKEG